VHHGQTRGKEKHVGQSNFILART